MEPILILAIIGAAGGALRSVIGYEYNAEENETFNTVKFVKSAARGTLAGASLIYGTIALTNTPITTGVYILAFLTSAGADVMGKEGYGIVKEMAKQKFKGGDT